MIKTIAQLGTIQFGFRRGRSSKDFVFAITDSARKVEGKIKYNMESGVLLSSYLENRLQYVTFHDRDSTLIKM